VNIWCLQWQRLIQKIQVVFGLEHAKVDRGFMGRKCQVNDGAVNFASPHLNNIDPKTLLTSGTSPNQPAPFTQSASGTCIPICSDITVADAPENLDKAKVFGGFGAPDSRHSKGGVLCFKACKIELPSQIVQIVSRPNFQHGMQGELKTFLRKHNALTPEIEKRCRHGGHYPDFVYEATFTAVKEVRCINPMSHSNKVRKDVNTNNLDPNVHGIDKRSNWSVRTECGRMGQSQAGKGGCPKDCKVPKGAPKTFKGCVGGKEFRGLLERQLASGGAGGLVCKVYKSCKLVEAKLTHIKERPNCAKCPQFKLKPGHTIQVPKILAEGHKAGCANF